MLDDDARAFGLTDSEKLWDRVSHERLLELIDDAETIVVASERDSNSYGEFRFVSLRKGNYFLTAWGHGWHDCRERTIVDTWNVWLRTSRPYDENDTLDKWNVKKVLRMERETYQLRDAKQRKQPRSESAELFAMLADMGDEDGALVELQDAGYM